MIRLLRRILLVSAFALLAGCVGTPIVGEREMQARARTDAPGAEENLPAPDAAERANLEAYARYALGKSPTVRAAYLRWKAASYDVTAARSQPDPKLSLQFDYDGGLTSLMPGAMFDVLAREKRRATGKAALAGAEVARRVFVATQLEVLANLRNAWIDLAYTDEAVRLQQEVAVAYKNAADSAANDYVTTPNGRLAEVTRTQSDAARQAANRDELLARRDAARAAFKAAMGLSRGDPDPVWPTAALKASNLPDEDALWDALLRNNPELATLRSAVDEAMSEVAVARTAKKPDYSLGAMADLKASPLMLRPQVSMTLPLWKDKIAAGIEAANARADAAKAEVRAGEIALAAAFAEGLYEIRAADLTLRYIDETQLPALLSARAFAVAEFQSGGGMASAPAMARAEEAMARLERLETLRRRERAATELLRLSAGLPGTSAQ